MRVRRWVTCSVVAASAAAFLAIAAPSASATGTTYWISPSGSDAAAGTSGAPFQTIQHCATVAVAGDTCDIETGTYRESVVPTHSGSAGNPITFTGAPGATVSIDGSDALSGWTLSSGQIYKASVTISSSVQGLQLFQGSTSIPSARWPATGTDLLHNNRATAAAGTTHVAATGVSTINTTGLPSGLVGATVTFWGGFAWLAQTAVIATSSAGQLTFTGGTGQCAASPYNQLCVVPGTRYYVSNSLSLLTAAGQWYYDSSAHLVYYWAPSGGVPSGVTIKQRNYAFDLSGRSYINVQNLSLFGDTVTTDSHTMTDTSRTLPADCNQIPDPSYGGTHNTIDSITATYVSQFDKIGECGTTDDVVARLYLYRSGIVLNGSYNTLQNSSIDWSAGNGVAVLGDHNTVTNNLIRDTDYMGGHEAGVYVQGHNQTISHNTMYNTGQSGMVGNYFGDGIPQTTTTDFTNNTISYNNIFDFGLLDQDGGGMYFCCSESAAGGSIDHNWVHDGQQPGVLGYGGAVYQAEGGIYLDAGSQDFTVSRNVAWNDGGRNMAVNGRLLNGAQSTPQNVNVYNNTFAATPTSFGAGNTYYEPNLTGSLFENNIFTGPVVLNGVDDPTQSHNMNSAATSNYINPTAGDLRLTRTPTASPAIDAGMVISGVTNGYVGTAPDQGAYESGGDQWVAGCNFAGCVVPNDPAHSIDDASSTITGTWTRATNAVAYGGTDTYSNTTGSTQTFTFSGTQAQLYGVLSNVGGFGTISLDGGAPTTVDFYQYNGMGDSLVYTTPVLANGSHTVTVTVTGVHSESNYTYVALDRLTYTSAGSTSYIDDATAGIADNSINYVGTGWVHCTVNCNAVYGQTFYNGTATGDNIAGESMYVSFTGTRVSLIGFVGSNGETTPTVSVDGGPSVPITFYAVTPALTSVYLSPVLPWGHHSLRMDVGGPSTAWASFDDLVVTP